MTARALDAYPQELRDAVARTRDVVAALHAELPRWGLVVWTAGNVSARVPGPELLVIKPSGIGYDELSPEAMVVCDLEGNLVEGERAPSRSEERRVGKECRSRGSPYH